MYRGVPVPGAAEKRRVALQLGQQAEDGLKGSCWSAFFWGMVFSWVKDKLGGATGLVAGACGPVV